MSRKPPQDDRQASFDFGRASRKAAPREVAVPSSADTLQDLNIMHVDTGDKDSVQIFLKRVARGRFGDLQVSFDGSEPQFIRSCLVNLNNPDVVHSFINGIDDDRTEYTGETINFATPLIFITHHTVKQSVQELEDITHFRAFTAAADGKEDITIQSSLLNCSTHPSWDNNNFSSIVLVNEMQLSKEISRISYEPVSYYLGLNALHEQREVVLAQTRNTPRRSPKEFLKIPSHQPRLA